MLANKHITLRAVEPEDLEFLYKIENESSLWLYSARKEPYSRFAIRQYINNYDQSVFERGQLRFMIVLNDENVTIGTIDIFDFDYNNRKAEIGIFIDLQYRHNGYAAQAIELLSSYSKDFLNLHQLYSYVESQNKASRQTMLKCGFTHMATLKEWLYFSSRYHDIDIFQKIL